MEHTSIKRYQTKTNKRDKNDGIKNRKKDELDLISLSLWKKRISRERKKREQKEKQEEMESLLFSQSVTSLCNIRK
jgi:hypothetical protein